MGRERPLRDAGAVAAAAIEEKPAGRFMICSPTSVVRRHLEGDWYGRSKVNGSGAGCADRGSGIASSALRRGERGRSRWRVGLFGLAPNKEEADIAWHASRIINHLGGDMEPARLQIALPA